MVRRFVRGKEIWRLTNETSRAVRCLGIVTYSSIINAPFDKLPSVSGLGNQGKSKNLLNQNNLHSANPKTHFVLQRSLTAEHFLYLYKIL